MEGVMPIPWEKVMPQRPQMLQTARGWYEKWIKGDRPSANDGIARRAEPENAPPEFEDGGDKVEAYAEPVSIEDVVEVRETTRDVASRLDALEFAGMAQAETIKNLSEQSQTLTRSLSDLQRELNTVDQRLQDTRADAESHRSTMESYGAMVERLEGQLQKLSGDLSRARARANMALWVGLVGVVGAIVTIGAVFAR
jgi:methyl-accepting chemotaxis protein